MWGDKGNARGIQNVRWVPRPSLLYSDCPFISCRKDQSVCSDCRTSPSQKGTKICIYITYIYCRTMAWFLMPSVSDSSSHSAIFLLFVICHFCWTTMSISVNQEWVLKIVFLSKHSWECFLTSLQNIENLIQCKFFL